MFQIKYLRWLNKLKKNRLVHMLPTRDILQHEIYAQTEAKEMRKGILCKWKQKSQGSNPYIRQNRL